MPPEAWLRRGFEQTTAERNCHERDRVLRPHEAGPARQTTRMGGTLPSARP
jgi:hypothetical protein